MYCRKGVGGSWVLRGAATHVIKVVVSSSTLCIGVQGPKALIADCGLRRVTTSSCAVFDVRVLLHIRDDALPSPVFDRAGAVIQEMGALGQQL